MKLHDPFNRMEARDENHYRSFRESLSKAGVTTQAQAEEALASVKSRTKVGAMFVLVVTGVLALVFPEYQLAAGVFGAVLLFWFYQTHRRASKFINRYINEDLGTGATDAQTVADAQTLLKVDEIPNQTSDESTNSKDETSPKA